MCRAGDVIMSIFFMPIARDISLAEVVIAGLIFYLICKFIINPYFRKM